MGIRCTMCIGSWINFAARMAISILCCLHGRLMTAVTSEQLKVCRLRVSSREKVALGTAPTKRTSEHVLDPQVNCQTTTASPIGPSVQEESNCRATRPHQQTRSPDLPTRGTFLQVSHIVLCEHYLRHRLLLCPALQDQHYRRWLHTPSDLQRHRTKRQRLPTHLRRVLSLQHILLTFNTKSR